MCLGVEAPVPLETYLLIIMMILLMGRVNTVRKTTRQNFVVDSLNGSFSAVPVLKLEIVNGLGQGLDKVLTNLFPTTGIILRYSWLRFSHFLSDTQKKITDESDDNYRYNT